jgi:hypothetical protein
MQEERSVAVIAMLHVGGAVRMTVDVSECTTPVRRVFTRRRSDAAARSISVQDQCGHSSTVS